MGKTAFFMVFAAFALSACGGGGGIAMQPPAPNPPTAAECNAQNQILDGDACRSCGGDTPLRVNNECRPQFNTAEYRQNWALGAVHALSAYNGGFHGQGVTVGLQENTLPYKLHADLRRHVLLPDSAPGIGYDRHGSGVAGIIGGARNGNLSHGVAPSVQLVFSHEVNGPLKYPQAFTDAPIKNYSIGLVGDFNTMQGLMNSRQAGLRRQELSVALLSNNSIGVTSAGNDRNHAAPFQWGDTAIPHVMPELAENFIAVAALNAPQNRQNYNAADLTLHPQSNACGHGKMWCVAAPGVDLTTPSTANITSFQEFSGTSAAAPVVSGVLAVMKSAADTIAPMPMPIIRAIMLSTAMDLGADGPDEIYGWGMPNLSAAIVSITSMKTANLAGLSAVPLRSLRHEFPAEFSRLRGQLSKLTVAVEITHGAYYNMPLADIIPQQQNNINFGNAAEELLNENNQNQQNGFAAFGDSDNGFGLRWHNNFQSGGVQAELSYLPKTPGIVGAETAAKIGLRRPLFGGFMFGKYGGGFAKTQTGGGYVAAAEDISTEEWTMGAEVLDILRAGDKLRFSVRSGKRIRGGKVRVSLPVATGDFYQSFLGEKMQDLHISRQDISLSENAPLIYSAGYSVRGEKTEWAMAAELSETGGGKLSAKWRLEF